MKRVVFLLPNNADKPIGGAKVIFEYANRFANDGFNVDIVYAAYSKWMKFGLLHTVYYLIRYLYTLFSKNYCPRWFHLSKSINQHLVWSLDKYKYPQDAKIIATAIDTAYYLNKYQVRQNNKFYFIQGFENWFVSDEFVKETYKYNLNKITISNWLKQLIDSCGEYAALVPNGYDMNYFKLIYPIMDRNRYEIACLYHTDQLKGLDIAFHAFMKVKKKFPKLHITMFGFPNKPNNLDPWITYYQKPDKETLINIYNKAAIFVGTSYFEGWGLTIGEAMASGCAVACTDNMGYKEMAKDSYTALLSPVGNAEMLADNINRLISDDNLRKNIATNGYKFIKRFDIENSYLLFKQCIEK